MHWHGFLAKSSRTLLTLLDRHRQVHSWMNDAIQMKGASRGEGSDRLALIGSGELQVVDGGCPRFCSRLSRVILPPAIGNDMGDGCIIDQIDTAPLADGHGRWGEVGLPHVHIGTAAPASISTTTSSTAPAGDNPHGHHNQDDHRC